MAEEWEWIGWLGIPAHPDSPSGGPGPGFFRPAGPRSPSTGGLLDPHAPAVRGLSGSDVEGMLNQHRAEAAIGRAHRAADLQSLRFATNSVLGHYSFGAGVCYGLVNGPTVAIGDLLELGRIFVLADFYDRIYGSQRWRFTFGPTLFAETGLRMMLATGLMSRGIIERAHQEREAILAELEHIISNPLESLASIPEAVAKQYTAQWGEYQLHAASSTLDDQFRAGTILGELLFEVLSLVAGIGSGVGAAAKLAARAPKLARFSRVLLGGKGGGGAAGELAGAAAGPSRSAAGVAKTPSQLAAEARAAPPRVKRGASAVPSPTPEPGGPAAPVAGGSSAVRRIPVTGARLEAVPDGSLHNRDWAKIEAPDFEARRSEGVDMDALSPSDGSANKILLEAGYDDAVERQQILNSGHSFTPRPLARGERLYGVDSADYVGKRANSPYWMDEAGFKDLESKFKHGELWDRQGVKEYLALPCFNRADGLVEGVVVEDHVGVASTIGRATENVTYQAADGLVVPRALTMQGGGQQVTPALGKIVPGGGL